MFLGLYHQPLGKLDGFVSLCQSCIEAIFRHDAPEKGSSNLCHGRDTLIYWIQIRHSNFLHDQTSSASLQVRG